MDKFIKYLIVICLSLISISFTSCEKDDDDIKSSKETYSFSGTQHFSNKWIVIKIIESSKNSRRNWYFQYDENHRPIYYEYNNKQIKYSYDGKTCTLSIRENYTSEYKEFYKGYFDDNKLIKAGWGEYLYTDVTYEGSHLIEGINGYKLTWNSKGNIIKYSDCATTFEYTDLPNRANIDFNAFLTHLGDCWCDDGSQYFTEFGWTGARTTNLISKRIDNDRYYIDFSFELDELGRPVKIQVTHNDSSDYTYYIEYMED